MTEMRKYWRALKRHPGVPIATASMAMGFVAGASKVASKGGDWIVAGLIGAAFMSVFWLIVLLTAWDMRNDE
jgi:hypothetical protein